MNGRLLTVVSVSKEMLELRHANGAIRKAPWDLPYSTALEIVRSGYRSEPNAKQLVIEATALAINGGEDGIAEAKRIWQKAAAKGAIVDDLLEVFKPTRR